PESPARREEILLRAAAVAMADGSLVDTERRYLSALARGLGYGVEEVREALRRAKEGSESAPPALDLALAPEPEVLSVVDENEAQPAVSYSCLTPGGLPVTVSLFSSEVGLDVTTSGQTRRRRYAEVHAVHLGLRADESCVCAIHLANSPPLLITNLNMGVARAVQQDYEYLEFVKDLHTHLWVAKVRPTLLASQPGGRGRVWLRIAGVALPGAAVSWGLYLWAQGVGELGQLLLHWLAFLAAVITVVAAGHLVIKAVQTSASTTYTPPAFPACVLPGADDLTVAEALSKGGVVALWIIAAVMSRDDD
ncbi:MAG: hypothetical protein JKY65_04810, partial [Planctomycetes bacterium]|nr:hypothetical protein [Planctomycetota bacterium]